MFFFKYGNIYTHLRFKKLISEFNLCWQCPLKPNHAQLPLCSASLFTESSLIKTATSCSRAPQPLWGITSSTFLLLILLCSDSAPAITCEHAAGCHGLTLGFFGEKTREREKPGEAEERGEAARGQQPAGGQGAWGRDGGSSAAEEKFLWF